MNKFKLAFVAIAIAAGVGGAFASKPTALCEGQTQYYYNGSYLPAGVYGVDYACWDIPGSTCTYYKPDPFNQPNSYAPCRPGSFQSTH